MRAQTTALEPRHGVLVLSGYGVHVSVHHGRLVLSDNLNGERRHAELSRATCGIQRLVVLGHTGFVTLDALRWIADIGAAYVQIDADGKVTACYAPQSVNDVSRRRAQALCAQTPVGMRIMRPVIEAKVDAQAALMRGRGHAAVADRIVACIADLASDSIDAVRFAESRAADVYWTTFASVPMRFAKRYERRMPAHWRTAGARKSALGNAPRNATTPAQALWNLLYSVIETETRIAVLAHGLEPEIGLMHAMRRYSSGLVHDLMEPLRPVADAWILDLLESHVFAANDFVETRQGIVRLAPPLPQLLAGTAPWWRDRAMPLAAWLATSLDSATDGGAGVRLKRLPAVAPATERLDLAPRCRRCGKELPEYRRKDCADCAVAVRDAGMPAVIRAGQAALAQLRQSGGDTSHARQATRKRSRAIAQRHAEARAWSRTRAQVAEDRETFRRDVLPRLEKLEVAEVARLTGLSKAQCSLVRRGLRTLHPRHWTNILSHEPRRPA